MDTHLEARFDQIQKELESLVVEYRNIRKDVEKHGEVLFGGKNIHTGLLTRVVLLEDKIDSLSKKIDETNKEVLTRIDGLQKQLNNSNTKTMLYILTAISAMNGLISILIAVFH